jgi:hypothetical protein
MRSVNKILMVSLVMLALLLTTTKAASANCGLVPSQISSQISSTEPWYCPINQQIYSQWVTYLPIAMVAVFISFGIASIIFMVGVVLNSNSIRNFGRGEFYEALATAIIVVGFLYLCAVVFGIWPGTYVGNINPYATAFNMMTNTISTAEQMYTVIFNVYLALSYTVSPTISLHIGGTTPSRLLSFIGFVPQLFVNSLRILVTIYFLDPAQAIAGFITDGILALYSEYYLLVFFSVAAIPVFLIPGTIFRAIFPTRALGGILIALAFGFYLIMPSLFAVAYYFTAPTIQRDMGLATLQVARLSYVPQEASSPSSPLAAQLSNVKSSVNGFWLLIFFYPGLIIAITYASVQEIANFIGRASYVSAAMRRFI